MQQRSEETRASILDAALDVFAHQGYDAASVSHICAAAGVSKGAFYHHFPSKQDVFLELLRRWLAGLDERLNGLRQEEEPVPDTLVRMTGMMAEVFQAAGNHLPMFLEFWAQASHDPAFWTETIAPYRRYGAFFGGLAAQGVETGAFKPVDPGVTGHVILALALGILLQGVLDPEGADWENVLQEGMALLLLGLKKEEAA